MASNFSEIKPISKSSVHRICSGQVVLSLAIAVKELLENAIDAGATSVDVKLKNYGLDLISVTDNGCGIAEDNYAKLTMKHYTSKIQDFDDLTTVATFGFRGEALSSLCALSTLSMATCTEGEQSGTEVTYDKNGRIVSQNPCAHEQGTTLRLEALFSEWPVRLRELQKNIKREFGKLVQLLNAYCLVRPDVRITCVNITCKGTRSSVLQSPGKGTVASVIKLLFGMKQMRALVPVKYCRGNRKNVEESKRREQLSRKSSVKENSSSHNTVSASAAGSVAISIDGYVSSVSGPNGGGRSSNDRQFLSINQRPCDMPKVARAIAEVFHVYDRSKSPVYVLNITLPRAKVDINVTPDKRSIFTLQESQVIDAIKETLQGVWAPNQHQYDLASTQSSLSSFVSATTSDTTSTGGSDIVLVSASAATKQPSNDTMQASNPKDISTLPVREQLKRKSQDENDGDASPTTCSDAGSPSKVLGSRMAKRRRTAYVCNVRGCVKYRIDMHSLAALESHYEAKHPRRKAMATTEEKHHRFTVRRLATSQRSDPHEVSDDESGVLLNNDDVAADTSDTILSSRDCTSSADEVRAVDDAATPACKAHARIDTAPSSTTHDECVAANPEPISNVDGEMDNLDHVQQQDAARMQAVAHAEGNAVLTEVDIANVQASNAGKTRPENVQVAVSLDRISQCLQKKDLNSLAPTESGNFFAVLGQSTDSEAEAELSRTISQPDFLRMEIVGQFNLGFIVTRLGNDLFIVDQHASEEKYNFERLQATTQLQTQRLVVPRRLELTSMQESVLVDNIDIFRRNGFDFAVDATALPTQRVRMTKIPYSKGTTFGASDVDELIFMLTDEPHKMCRPSRVRAMFASRACRTSVMIGTALNTARMRGIIDHMSTMSHPWNCPHGRPTMRHMFDLRRMPPQ
eukprot:m.1424371 g.1424371  ORF g.1424371 m.1424371 type:complete len:916 (+) comp25061_c0_seq19:134-2881(+)